MSKPKRAFKDYVVPHDGNDNRPYLLRPKAIAFMCVVVLVAESVFVFGAKYLAPQSTLYGIIEANALVDETNQNRVENNLPTLQISPLLQTAAQDKANDMATKDYFAHTSPQGLTPWYWFEQVGYNFDYAGENLAVNFSDSQDVTNAWMNSPEHRANILSVNFTQIGIATAQGTYNGEPATYVVEEFGTPAAVSTPFVDTASAASIPASAGAPTTVTPTTGARTTPTPAPAKKPAPTKASAEPIPAPVSAVPVVVAMQNSQTTSSEQSFVAVKGASVQAGQTAPAAAIPAQAGAGTNNVTPTAQSNVIQTLFSDPKTLTDDFYIILMIIFALALILNVFINIRVQYPRLIAGGLLVIVVAGLCIMLNQNIGFLHVIVL
jgi:Cysteine-rich secretory protein family